MTNRNEDDDYGFKVSDNNASLLAATASNSNFHPPLSAEDRAALRNELKNKLRELARKPTDILGYLSPKVRKRVEVLLGFQREHDKLKVNFYKERAALESKYQKLYDPFYTKRYEIVNGIVEVDGVTNETPMNVVGDKSTAEKGVPAFWLNAMKAFEILDEEITKRDESALKYLKDIKCCRINDIKGFKLDFHFEANPYFKNTVLTKTYHVIEQIEPILEMAVGTDIEWYPGKILTQKILKKKPKKGESKNAKPETKTEDCPSFFNFFCPPHVPEDDADIDEETAEELQNQIELDHDIGLTIRDKIIPHAVAYFIEKPVRFDDHNDMEDDDEYEDEDDEDDIEDKVGQKKRSRATAREGQRSERPPECKIQ